MVTPWCVDRARCSWANIVERFFSELTTKRIRREGFQTVAQLEAAIYEFIQHHNQHGKPKAFAEIVQSINRCYRN